ncbi:unnamed protein product [Parascedosporium putredinis]|uniref:Tyrosinase copper-binding domain-containing protein n=1 Tax=Parascedosporium putredinis TaxID=1442378 RepID=A0A9P1GXA4_9PEZI|nr:unnamed protein product [Parascedosporium putredinis]CAI7988997.1 unnamed protein product [Parascedosporium putredinis]
MQLTILATALLAVSASAAPTCCTNAERREWRTFSTKEKQAYIAAVKCLQSKPSQLKSTYPTSQNRFDDFQAVHIDLTEKYHFTGPFQAWHRVFLHKYESDLRGLCAYKGYQPSQILDIGGQYWTKDSGSEAAFLASPVFDAVNGFGGNGPYVDTSNFPVTNVPVKIPNKTGGGYWTLEAASFAVFDFRLQGTGIEPEGMTVHAGGHLDPLFYLHHANLDRLWDQWQRKKFAQRVQDMTGPDTMWAYPFNFFGDVPYTNITLETLLDFKGLLGSSSADRYVKIKDVMDSQGPNLCVFYK